jgi:hypothetical protein
MAEQNEPQTLAAEEPKAKRRAKATNPQETHDPALNIYQRMLLVMGDISGVEKKGKPSQGAPFEFVRHDDVMAAVRPALVAHGVMPLLSPDRKRTERFETKTANNKPQELWLIWCDLHFVNVDSPEDRIVIQVPGEGLDMGDKGIGKALSYAVKNALLKTFLLPGGDAADNEAENVELTGTTQPSRQRRQQAQPAQTRTASPQGGNAAQAGSTPQEQVRPMLRTFWIKAREMMISEGTVHAFIQRNYEADSTRNLTDDQLKQLTLWVRGLANGKEEFVARCRKANADTDAVMVWVADTFGIADLDLLTAEEWTRLLQYVDGLAADDSVPGHGADDLPWRTDASGRASGGEQGSLA